MKKGKYSFRNIRYQKIASINVIAAICLSAMTSILFSQTPDSDEPVRLNRVIENLKQGKPALAATDFDTFSKESGDWLFIDMEHGPYDLDRLETTLSQLLYRSSNRPKLTPIVRIPMEGDEDFSWAVKQILDMGAFGIVFPHIETKEQALKAVRAMRYPPQRGAEYPEPRGRRGLGPGWASRYWGIPTSEYMKRADVWPLNPNGELLAMIMIETEKGVENIEEILEVPGIVVFVGPGDMSLSMGVLEHPEEIEPAIQAIANACRVYQIYCGMGGHFEGKALEDRISQGFQFFGRSIDLVNELGRIPSQ